ncbi:MAG: hypothetical protein B6U76_02220 [Desulfurococcales archaeon ex4484_217_2]|nr:MAG: hypothetical protein B6U76_02220 [Desulfurococcales archaeon ex4484_217_2]
MVGMVQVKLVMDRKGRILIPKKIREKLGTRVFRLVLREDGVVELHPLYDPLSLKGSVKLGLSVEELEEAGEKFAVERAKGGSA